MAHTRPTTAYPGHVASPPVDRPEDLALDIPPEEAPGADQVHDAAVSVAVTYPDWRAEELARKYSDDEPEERYERGFYHPYG